jgi:NADH:ubiquinone oxidoreductase subunit F (NADH-binding)/NADH:ubiquinone oxidoreductase subunit E
MIVQELHRIQHEHGYLPEDQLRALADRIGQPLYRLHEVASFYPHYHLRPPPPAEVKVCCDMACHLAGGENLRRHLDEAGKQVPGTVAVTRVSCLGRCDAAPAVSINGCVYWNKSASELEALVQAAAAQQPLPEQKTAKAAPRWQIDPYVAHPYQGQRSYAVLRRLAQEWLDDADADIVRKRRRLGDGILKSLETNNLRGMGGAGFPTFIKWSGVRDAKSEVKYVVCNGDESEPGTFKDRDLLIFAPHLLVEGIVIAGLVTGAQRGFIFIRHEYQEPIEAVRAEVDRARRDGICGENILGTGISFSLEVLVSPGGYICGEETALLEAIEDRRAEPRNKPPMVHLEGLFGMPTVVNNVETFSWVPAIVQRGGTWYKDQGKRGAAGLRFVSISGHVARPGVYEVPFGQTVRELIWDTAGGMSGGRRLKAIAASGPSGGFLPAVLDLARVPAAFVEGLKKRGVIAAGAAELDILDLPLDPGLLQPFPDFMLGAAFVVYGDDADMLREALNCVEFYRNESCGKCVPCRLGTQKMVEMIGELLAGQRHDDLATFDDLAETMLLTSICGLGQVAANPIRSVLLFFRTDVDKYSRG